MLYKVQIKHQLKAPLSAPVTGKVPGYCGNKKCATLETIPPYQTHTPLSKFQGNHFLQPAEWDTVLIPALRASTEVNTIKNCLHPEPEKVTNVFSALLFEPQKENFD